MNLITLCLGLFTASLLIAMDPTLPTNSNSDKLATCVISFFELPNSSVVSNSPSYKAFIDSRRSVDLVDLIGCGGPGIKHILQMPLNSSPDQYANALFEVAKSSDQKVRLRIAITIWRMREQLTWEKRKQAAEAISGMEKKVGEYKKFSDELYDLTKN